MSPRRCPSCPGKKLVSFQRYTNEGARDGKVEMWYLDFLTEVEPYFGKNLESVEPVKGKRQVKPLQR